MAFGGLTRAYFCLKDSELRAVHSSSGMEGDRLEVGSQKPNIHVEVCVKSYRWVRRTLETENVHTHINSHHKLRCKNVLFFSILNMKILAL